MVGSFSGTLVGYRTYDKDGQSNHVYFVYGGGAKKDPVTGLFEEPPSVVSIIEKSAVLENPKAGMLVAFYGEMVSGGKNGAFMRYSGIRAATN